MAELNDLHLYREILVSGVDYDFSSNRHENIPHRLYADWAALIIKLAKVVFPSFVAPTLPESLKFQTESIPTEYPYPSSPDYRMVDYAFCELKTENGSGLKIGFEKDRWDGDNCVKIETLGFDQGVSSHIAGEAKSPLAGLYIWHTEGQKSEIEETIARHREYCLTKPIQIAVPDYSNQVEKCSLCGVFPEDLTVNTGRDQDFPDAFWKLTGMKLGSTDYGQFRRCPACGSYFKWIDSPQMYGSGNNAEERLIRFPPQAAPLLEIIFSPDAKDRYDPGKYDPGKIDEYFEFIELELLLDVLKLHARYAPQIFALFVPRLGQLLFRNGSSSIRSLLTDYVSDDADRAEEVLETLRTLQAAGYQYPLIDVFLHCFTVAQKKK